MAASIETRNLVGSALAVLLVGIAFITVLRFMDQTQASADRRGQLNAALQTLEQGISQLKDAETGQRGFLLTGNPEYLAPYESGREQAPVAMAAFVKLPGARNLAPADLARLQALASAKLEELAHTIQLAHEGKREEAQALVMGGQGFQTMDQLRALQTQLGVTLAEERNLEDLKLRSSRQHARDALLLLGSFGLLCIVSSAWILHRDIALRTTAERALAASEAKFRALADHAPVGIFEMDLDSRRPYINETLCAFAGLSYEEASTKGFRHRIHEEDLDRVLAHWDQVRATGIPALLEYRYVLPNGSVRWVESRAATVPGPDGRPHSFVGIVVDQTEHRQAQEELKASERRFRTLAESAPVGIYEYDFERGMVYANEAHCRLAGVPREEATRERLRAAVHPEDRPRVIERVEADMRGGLAFDQIYRLLHPDGSVIWTHSRGTAIEDQAGHARSYLIISQDITAIRAAEAEILAKAEALEAANKELEAFAYSVSHDLRAPLRHIDGFVGLLRRTLGADAGERARHQLDVISAAARQMGDLIDDLLTFSRMGRAEVHKAVFDLGSLTRRVIEELAPDTEGRHIEWHIGDLPSVQGDPALLRLVLSNLIGNALKFTRGRAPARIGISAATRDGAVTITIADNGAGFDMRYADKLFGVFQRLHRQDEFEGTGIGLANVARIVHKHGGVVAAEGAVGEGATFTFTLPAPEAA